MNLLDRPEAFSMPWYQKNDRNVVVYIAEITQHEYGTLVRYGRRHRNLATANFNATYAELDENFLQHFTQEEQHGSE